MRFFKFFLDKSTLSKRQIWNRLSLFIFFIFMGFILSVPIFFNNFSLASIRKRNNLFSLLFLVLMGSLLSSPAKARTLTVRAPFKTMTLNYNQKKISIKGNWLDLSMKRKKCNGYILDRFNRQMNKLLKSKALRKKRKETESLEVQFDRKKLFVPPRSREAWAFLNLPVEVQRMKLGGDLYLPKKVMNKEPAFFFF